MAYAPQQPAGRTITSGAVHMRFGSPPGRPHEDQPLRTGDRTGSVLIAFHALPDVDVNAVMAEVEKILREVLDGWYRAGGHELVESVPQIG